MFLPIDGAPTTVAPRGGHPTVSLPGVFVPLAREQHFIPHFPPLRLESVWYISPVMHTVLDVQRRFVFRSHGSDIVSLCSRLCRASPCYTCQGQTSRHHPARLHTDRWIRSIYTLRKCGILQSISNTKLGLRGCVHSLLPTF